MKNSIQRFIQIVFLILFLILIKNGKIQMWMGLFFLSIAASFLLSRIYCGWICPINSAMKGVTWLKKKLHIKELKIPNTLEKPWLRFLVLVLFIFVFIFTISTSKKLPVLPSLFAIGVIITFFFPEELWHFYLCPYGTIFSFSGSSAKHHMLIDEDKCNNCTMCSRVCPTKAIVKKEKHQIVKRNCLVCMECSVNCKQNAISYK